MSTGHSDLTTQQFLAEVAALATPAEYVASCGAAMPSDDMAKLLDRIICEARRQRGEA